MVGGDARSYNDKEDTDYSGAKRDPIIAVALGMLRSVAIFMGSVGPIMTWPEWLVTRFRHGLSVPAGRGALIAATVFFLLSALFAKACGANCDQTLDHGCPVKTPPADLVPKGGLCLANSDGRPPGRDGKTLTHR